MGCISLVPLDAGCEYVMANSCNAKQHELSGGGRSVPNDDVSETVHLCSLAEKGHQNNRPGNDGLSVRECGSERVKQ